MQHPSHPTDCTSPDTHSTKPSLAAPSVSGQGVGTIRRGDYVRTASGKDGVADKINAKGICWVRNGLSLVCITHIDCLVLVKRGRARRVVA